jgi:ABC-type uncharacterized transport system ATPase subunit
MALASKGSRSLTVDGIAYRWSVRRRPTYCQEMGWSNLSFAVEAASAGLCTLHVTTQATRADSVADLSSTADMTASMIVTPALVAHGIRQALEQGWQPQQRGSAFELRLTSTAEIPPLGN